MAPCTRTVCSPTHRTHAVATPPRCWDACGEVLALGNWEGRVYLSSPVSASPQQPEAWQHLSSGRRGGALCWSAVAPNVSEHRQAHPGGW